MRQRRLRQAISSTVAILVAVTLIGNPTAQAAPTSSPFTDVAPDHVFLSHITWLADQGISTGYETPAGIEFRPSQAVLREQMAAFLYRLAGQPDFAAPQVSPFTDVSTSHVFYREITWLADQGITTGYETPAGIEFRPSQPVLREQMAAFLYRYEGGTPHSSMPRLFSDVSFGHVFYNQIWWLSGWQISTGYQVGTRLEFRPAQPVLREQMAAFLYRLKTTTGLGAPEIDLPEEIHVPLGAIYNLPLRTLDNRPPGLWQTEADSEIELVGTGLPDGLKLNVNRIEGYPTTPGTWPVLVTFTDTNSKTTQKSVDLTVFDPGEISPDDAMTRIELATEFYECAGSPAVIPPQESPFSDIDPTHAQYAAAIWAQQEDLFDADGTQFRPDDPENHAYVAGQLWAFHGSPAFVPPATSPYLDVAWGVGTPHARAIMWSAVNGLTAGEADGYFYPYRLADQAFVDAIDLNCPAS